MPFDQRIPTPFTSTNVQALKPGQKGVYGLLKEGVWVYVGSGDIRGRLLDHIKGDNRCIVREAPTHFVCMPTADYAGHERVEARRRYAEKLIRELRPVCNT